MRRVISLAVFAAVVGAAAPANAGFCMEPRAPSSLFLRKPSKPYCATDRSCEEWEVESYKADVRRYYDALKEYASSVDRFHKQAIEYVECMADLD